MTVRTVDLEDNVIGSDGTKCLAEVLNVNVYITELVSQLIKTISMADL